MDMLKSLEGKRGDDTRLTKNTVNYALDDLNTLLMAINMISSRARTHGRHRL